MSWTEYDQMEAEKYGGLSSDANALARRRLTPKARQELNYFLSRIENDVESGHSGWSDKGISKIKRLIRNIRQRKTPKAIKKNLKLLSDVLYRRV